MDDLTTERSFDSQATWVIDVLGLFFDMLSMGVCINRHWQTSGQLVRELNVCTVPGPSPWPKYLQYRYLTTAPVDWAYFTAWL